MTPLILVVFGTTGELIKLLPVLTEIRRRGSLYALASTGQQVQQIPRLLWLAGLPPVDVWLGNGANGRDLRANRDIVGWGATVATNFLRSRRTLRRRLTETSRSLVLVHGDTMTTVGGAMIGRLLGAQVAHIESGLRSFDLLHPFPEELNRRITSRLATLLYAPGPWAASNLRRGTIVDTGSNTIRDALMMETRRESGESSPAAPDEPFGIVSLHRFELLHDRRLFTETLEALQGARERLLFVGHPVTLAAIEQYKLQPLLRRFELIPRVDFFSFVRLMRSCAYVITDSGGSQEETFYLDIPCLVHRKKTERVEGIGENVCLSGFDLAVIDQFLARPEDWKRVTELPSASPSSIIVDDLEQRGYVARGRVLTPV